MKLKRILGRAVKVLIFFLIAALLFCLSNVFFTPKWRNTWRSTDTVTGFYALEEDSIDTLVLGSSQIISGVSAMQLYQEQGIRAYSLGTERQPVMGSYYLLKDALRTQPNIRTVVLEVTELFAQCNEASYRKAFDYMPLTSVKWEGIQERVRWAEKLDAEKGTNDAPTLASYALPILSYHERWNELSRDDFTYFLEDRSDLTRGLTTQPARGAKADYLPLDTESTAVCAPPTEEALYFFRAICAFCEEQNLSLVLLKTPRLDWTIEEYNTVSALAKEYDIPYLDFNTEKLNLAIGFDYGTDILKGSETHLNLSGAGKLTAYLGGYLTRHCPVLDVRTNPTYDYMAEDLTVYRQNLNDANLALVEDCGAYLSRLYRDRYSVLVAVNPAEACAYPDSVKRSLEQFGLDPRATDGSCYVAAVEQGTVLADQWSTGTVTQSVTLSDGVYCTLTSSGGKMDPSCSITIDGTEYAVNKSGLNIVVYNHETGKVVDSVAFQFTETETETGLELTASTAR